MVTGKPTNELIRLAVVLDLTGWSEDYVKKLRSLGVLDVYVPYPGARAWYHRSQIEKMIQPVAQPKTRK